MHVSPADLPKTRDKILFGWFQEIISKPYSKYHILEKMKQRWQFQNMLVVFIANSFTLLPLLLLLLLPQERHGLCVKINKILSFSRRIENESFTTKGILDF